MQGAGCRVQGAGCRVQGSGVRAPLPVPHSGLRERGVLLDFITPSISRKYDFPTKIATQAQLPATFQSNSVLLFDANRIGDPQNHVYQKYWSRCDWSSTVAMLLLCSKRTVGVCSLRTFGRRIVIWLTRRAFVCRADASNESS